MIPVLSHPTLDLLHDLGLHGMAKGFKALEQATEVPALEHAEWLGLLLEHEVTLRRQKRFEARARTARLRHNASVEDIDYHAARGLDRALFLIRPFIETGAAGLRSAKTSRAITSANALMLNDSSSARRTGFDSRLPRVLVLGACPSIRWISLASEGRIRFCLGA